MQNVKEKIKSINCEPGFDCDKLSRRTKAEAVVCFVVLLAVCGIFVYKAKTAKQTAPVKTGTAFVNGPVANEVIIGVRIKLQNGPKDL